jgi:hypothetical protein
VQDNGDNNHDQPDSLQARRVIKLPEHHCEGANEDHDNEAGVAEGGGHRTTLAEPTGGG